MIARKEELNEWREDKKFLKKPNYQLTAVATLQLEPSSADFSLS